MSTSFSFSLFTSSQASSKTWLTSSNSSTTFLLSTSQQFPSMSSRCSACSIWLISISKSSKPNSLSSFFPTKRGLPSPPKATPSAFWCLTSCWCWTRALFSSCGCSTSFYLESCFLLSSLILLNAGKLFLSSAKRNWMGVSLATLTALCSSDSSRARSNCSWLLSLISSKRQLDRS